MNGFWSQRYVTPALWVAAASTAGGLFIMYANDAQLTYSGQGSSLVPAHLMPYLSIVVLVYPVAVGSVLSLVRDGALPRGGGLALGAAAGLAGVLATPADRVWHAAFGVDSMLWSPPHLLSMWGTAALLVAALVATRGLGGAGRIGLGAALLGVCQAALLEYDSDVPQLPEFLYLPLLVGTGLGCAWIIRRTTGYRFAVGWTVAAYLLFRLLLLVILALAGLRGPDVPIALAGLAVVDIAPVRWRWPLAGLAVTLTQVTASALGLSSVGPGTVMMPALGVAVVLVAVMAGRTAVLATMGVGLVAGLTLASPAPARAHSPGSGPPAGAADIAVTGDGGGRFDVSVSRPRGVPATELTYGRLIAKRAGQTVTGDALGARPSNYAGTISLPTPGLWFVYLELPDREVWRAVEYDTTGKTVERRVFYQTSTPRPAPATEWLAGLLLYLLSATLLFWALRTLRRTGDDRTPAT